MADITVIYTNEEVGGDTPPSRGDRPDTPEPGEDGPDTPGPGEDEPDIDVTVEVPLGPPEAFPSDPEEPEQPFDAGELPRTGNNPAVVPVLLHLLIIASIGAAVSLHFILKLRKNNEE